MAVIKIRPIGLHFHLPCSSLWCIVVCFYFALIVMRTECHHHCLRRYHHRHSLSFYPLRQSALFHLPLSFIPQIEFGCDATFDTELELLRYMGNVLYSRVGVTIATRLLLLLLLFCDMIEALYALVVYSISCTFNWFTDTHRNYAKSTAIGVFRTRIYGMWQLKCDNDVGGGLRPIKCHSAMWENLSFNQIVFVLKIVFFRNMLCIFEFFFCFLFRFFEYFFPALSLNFFFLSPPPHFPSSSHFPSP